MYQLARLLSMTVVYCTLVAILERALTFVRTYVDRDHSKAFEIPQPWNPPRQDIKVVVSDEVAPLPDFDYSKQEPARYRPFVANRHVVMGKAVSEGNQSQFTLANVSHVRHQEVQEGRLDPHRQQVQGAH